MEEEKSKEKAVQDAVEEAKEKAAEEMEQEISSENPETTETDETAEQAEEEEPEENSSKDEESSAQKEEKKSEKKRTNKKNKKDEQIEALNDKLIRQAAEFDNYRKRTDKEKAQMYEIGAKDIIEKILPLIDNFERGLASVPEQEKDSPFVEGMEKTYKQFMDALEGIGVTPIDAVGQKFDPNFHNAVMHVDDEEYGENVVVEELQKGYMYRDSVVRHSMVKVAN